MELPSALRLAMPIALLLVSGSAAAQDREVDAERLFREGQKLLEERRFGEACPKFEAAYNKDHSLGTLLNLAFCHKEQGAVWYAWLEFREAEVKATELNRPDRRDFAKQHRAELEKQLPKMVIDNPQRVALTDVLVEDRKVWDAERGTVFAAESGQRRFIFKAKGKKNGVALIHVAKGDKVQHVAIPEMEDAPPPEPAPVVTDHGGDASKPEGPAAGVDAGSGATQRTIGWVAVGVGGVAAVIGTIGGIATLTSPCSKAPSTECGPDQRSSASTTGAISGIGFVVAGLGIVSGLALVLTAPSGPAAASPATPAAKSGPHVTPRVGLGWAGMSGTF